MLPLPSGMLNRSTIEERTMMEHKRSPLSIDQSSLNTFSPKRHKADLSISSKERKEKLSERIGALQQLVSPYGKTDTASVLLEAMEYIRFLHEQVKVLSAPYLQSTPTPKMQEKLDHTAFEAKAYVSCQFHVLPELLAAMVQISGPPSRPLHPNLRDSSPLVER
ncbi:unnamed protein product [Camellia sinensis]